MRSRQRLRPLLAVGDGDGTPVIESAFGLLGREPHDAAFSEHRRKAGRPELGRLLHHQVHALST